jgi:ABC-type sugar transport system ATPase subunit
MSGELSIKNVVKSYGDKNVINDISFEAKKGEFIVLVGPSGCGKSTMLRSIAGLETIDGGKIEIDGVDVSDNAPKDRDIAMVFQDYALYPHKNVYENIAFGLRIRKMPEDEIDKLVQSAAKKLNLVELLDRKPAAMSGGQRQRVAIGRSIVRNPKVFLFDEPLSNLDAKLRGDMRVTIARLHKDLEATVVYVTHDQVEAMTLADRIIVLNGGKIQQIGAPLELYYHPNNVFVATFIGSPTMNLIGGELDLNKMEVNGAGGIIYKILPNNIERIKKNAKQGQKVIWGLRPDNFKLSGNGSGAEYDAEVEVTELLGSTTSVHCKINGNDVNVMLPTTGCPSRGDKIKLVLTSKHMYLFDKESGDVI